MPRPRRRFAAMAIAVCMCLSAAGISLTAASEPSADESLDPALIAERATYGLGTDARSLARLAGEGDVGSALFGIPATADEVIQLDLSGRTEFGIAAHQGLIPYAESLEEYAGVFSNPSDNGNLTILVTSDDPQLQAEIERRAPAGSRTVTVALAPVPYSELVRVAELIRSLSLEAFPQTDIHWVGVEVQNNRVRVEVDEPRIGEMQSLLEREQGFGEVDVIVMAGSRGREDACFRWDCVDPMRAGNQIRREDQAPGYMSCTMGFHVSAGSNEIFLTAGHCGHGGDFDWHHPIAGSTAPIGNDGATWYVHNGVDAQRVTLPDAQASNLVFGVSGSVTGSFNPGEGETHCWSRGYTGGPPDCGTITDSYGSWTGDACGCTVWGTRASGVLTNPGDSGSPITFGTNAAWATGIHSKAFPSSGLRAFARVHQVVNHWNLTIPCGYPC